MLLVAAKILAGLKNQLKGNIKFVFQPNEENVGALAMIEEAWEKNGCMKLIAQFIKNRQKRHDRRILNEIKAAEEKNDQEKLAKLLKQKQKLAMRSQKQHLASQADK
jgi:hypothetical protein